MTRIALALALALVSLAAPALADPPVILRQFDTPGGRPTGIARGELVINPVDRLLMWRGTDGTRQETFLGGPWTDFTPTVSSGSGTLGSASASGRYQQNGKTVTFTASLTITNNGSGSNFVGLTLPVTSKNTTFFLAGENSVAPRLVKALVGGNSQLVYITNADNTYPGANGTVIVVSGTYEAP